jgi:serine/threonine protein kinase/Tfp pilus assembly protein PilF
LDETLLETGGLADRPAPDAPLDHWGPFERLQRVGRGSYGEVYRAFDPTLQRHVALKLLRPRGEGREAETNELLREARALARVRHPNVVAIHGVDRHAGRIGFWSDFVQGRTLLQLLDTQGPLGPREAALVGIDMCKAVAAVHAAGLLHRDIKAGNVMREDGGRILLVDFGLTHEHGIDNPPTGTPNYMAPELLFGRPATVASDIYAIGVLLFYLMTAQYPVTGADFEQLRQAHFSGKRRHLLDVRPDVPEAVAHVVDKAISPDPGERFTSVGQMATALSAAIGMEGAASASASEPRPEQSRTRWWTRTGIPMAAVALGLVFLPQIRRIVTSSSSSLSSSSSSSSATFEAPAAIQEDYRRAHELLAHYYRPHALETAIPLLQQIVAQDARFAPAHTDLGRASLLQFLQYREPKYLDAARESSLRALAIAPDMASAHVTLGTLYAHAGQNDIAAHELDEALRLDRLNAPAYGALADLYARQGRSELVEPTLKKAVSLAPDDWNLVQQLGEYYLDKSQWAQAGEQYRHAVELTPDNPRAHNNLGLVFRGLGQLDASAAAFQKAISIEPTALRYRNLGMVLAEAGKYAEAAQWLQKSIDMKPSQYRTWGILASVYRNQHEDEGKVRETFLKAIELAAPLRKETPRDAYLLADIGQYYAFVGMAKESLPLLAQAAALAPDTSEVLYEVAVGYEALGHREEALQWLSSAKAAGYPAEAIARNPQLAALRADARYR